MGDAIVIQAHNDFDVSGVSVSLADAGGNPLESGEAVETPARSGRWVYTAAAPTGTTVRIAVTAMDRPGGAGETERDKTV